MFSRQWIYNGTRVEHLSLEEARMALAELYATHPPYEHEARVVLTERVRSLENINNDLVISIDSKGRTVQSSFIQKIIEALHETGGTLMLNGEYNFQSTRIS